MRLVKDTDRARRTIVLTVVGLLCLSAGVGLASAQDQRAGGTVTIGPDETHEGDLEASAGTVVVEGTVDGDLIANGGSVTVTGNVTGDLTVNAGTVIIGGHVDGELTATGGDVRIRDGATVQGPVEIHGGAVTIDGTIEGDTRIEGETLTVGPTATIDGDLDHQTDEIEISEDATITGTITEREDLGAGPLSDVSLPEIPDTVFSLLAGIYLFLANLALGALALLLAPRFSDQVSTRGIDRPAVCGGVGLVTLIVTPAVIVMLLLSVVGIPLAFFATYGFIFLAWLGLVYGAFSLGTWGLTLVDRDSRWGALALGLAIVSLVNALPYVGFLLVAVVLLGLGALALGIYERWTDGNGDGEGSTDAPGSATGSAT